MAEVLQVRLECKRLSALAARIAVGLAPATPAKCSTHTRFPRRLYSLRLLLPTTTTTIEYPPPSKPLACIVELHSHARCVAYHPQSIPHHTILAPLTNTKTTHTHTFHKEIHLANFVHHPLPSPAPFTCTVYICSSLLKAS